MPSEVNLDALLPREDLAERSDVPNFSSIHTIGIIQLETGFFLNTLRKPDFQRETADWTPSKIFDLIRTFIDGELIPPVILWQSGGRVFVIDGAHRISSLLSWVHNDYGDGERSQQFFKNNIPSEQVKIAARVRKLVHSEIGAYSEYTAASKGIGTPDQKITARLPRLGVVAIPVQWVPLVTAKQAENSFFKINQAATPIDSTELRILKSRSAANAIASRAIVRGGAGHKYWAAFASDLGAEIEALAKGIHASLTNHLLQT
jgi:hypothetical protein